MSLVMWGHLFNPVFTLGDRMVLNHEADLQAWQVRSNVGDTESRSSGSPAGRGLPPSSVVLMNVKRYSARLVHHFAAFAALP
jgi:hypothetical protein